MKQSRLKQSQLKQHQDETIQGSNALGAHDIMSMAAGLIDQHGDFAVEIAEFMTREHAVYRDSERAQAWLVVSSIAMDMISGRLNGKKISLH